MNWESYKAIKVSGVADSKKVGAASDTLNAEVAADTHSVALFLWDLDA